MNRNHFDEPLQSRRNGTSGRFVNAKNRVPSPKRSSQRVLGSSEGGVHIGVAIVLIVVAFIDSAMSMSISSDDLWDVSNGTAVTASSPLHSASHSQASSMFGFFNESNLYNEGHNTLFSDRQVDGFIHYVEWETANPITVNSFNLVASHGPLPHYTKNDRGFKTFTLYSSADGRSGWNGLYSYDPPDPYGGGSNYPDSNYLELFDTFDAVTAQKFRAEFVQFGRRDINTSSAGPKIHELDGYYIVPEPSSVLLTTPGVMGIARYTTKRILKKI